MNCKIIIFLSVIQLEIFQVLARGWATTPLSEWLANGIGTFTGQDFFQITDKQRLKTICEEGYKVHLAVYEYKHLLGDPEKPIQQQKVVVDGRRQDVDVVYCARYDYQKHYYLGKGPFPNSISVYSKNTCHGSTNDLRPYGVINDVEKNLLDP